MEVRKAKCCHSAWLQKGPRGMLESRAPGMHSYAGTKQHLPPTLTHCSSTVSVLNLVKYWDGWSVYKLLCVVHKRLPHNFVPGQDHNFLEPKVEGVDGAIFFCKLKKR